MQNKIRENTTEKTSQLSTKKNENKKKNKSGSDDTHEKLKRKFSIIKVNRKIMYSPQKLIKKNISNNIIISKERTKLNQKAINNLPISQKKESDLSKENTDIKLKIETNIKKKVKNHKNDKEDETSEFQNGKEESKLSNVNTNISINNGKKSNEKVLILKEEEASSEDVANFIQKKNDLLKKIISMLNQDKLNESQFLEDLQKLLDVYPVINKFDKAKSELFSKNDFDIFDEEQNDKKFLFMVNLNNIIEVSNLLWEVSIKSPEVFVKYMIKLGIYFSFVKDKITSEIDFVIITPISTNLYNYISTYGKFIFKDHSLLKGAQSFIDFSDKYQYDVGYYFEDMNTINLIHLIGESNCKILPKIMYYIKEKAALRLIQLQIIKAPKEIKFHDKIKDIKDYKGYNEIDLIIYMKEEIRIKKNENFKFIFKSRDVNSSLELKKGHFYFFEFKNDVNDLIKDISQIEKNWKRFRNSLENIKITQDIKFDMNNSHLILFCDKNYDDVKRIIKSKKFKKDIIYSNPQIGLNILLKFNNKIKYLTQNVDLINSELLKQNKEIEEQKKNFTQHQEKIESLQEMIKSQKKEFDEKLKEQNNNFKDYIKEMDDKNELRIYNNEYESYKYSLSIIDYPMKIEYLIATKDLKNFNFEKCQKLYDCFLTLSKKFLKIKEKENPLCRRIIKFIGRYLVEKNEKEEWMALKNEFSLKIKNKNIGEYYNGLFLFLYGKDNDTKEDFDILSGNNSSTRNYVKNLIVFLSLFEENYNNIDDIEIKFQTVIIFIAYKLLRVEYVSKKFKNFPVISKEDKKDKVKSEIRKLMGELISGLNESN